MDTPPCAPLDASLFPDIILPHPDTTRLLTVIDGTPECLVNINTDGTIEFGPNYEPNEAARIFWSTMMDLFPGRVNTAPTRLREHAQYLLDAFIEGGYCEDAEDEHHVNALYRLLKEPEVEPTKSLAEMADDVTAWCVRKGWEPNPNRTFGDEITLLHTELSEAFEAYREGGFEDQTILGAQGESIGAKPEGVGSELADVLVRLLHTSASRGIDLEAEYKRKMAYNEGRPWRHGGKLV